MTELSRESVGDQHDLTVAAQHASRTVVCGVLLSVWLAVILARLMHAAPLNSANDRSRWCTVWSLVERGTYRIDEIRQVRGWDTIDLVKHDGHFYSTKPPLFPTLVAGAYWLEKQILGWSLTEETAATARVLLLVINILPMLLALALFARVINGAAQSTFCFVFVTAAACFATLLNPFLVVLNDHTPGAVSVMFALCAAVPILADERRRGWLFAAAGFWAACACCVQLPAAAFGLAMFVLLFAADRKRTLVWFVPAALIPLAGFFWTNYLVTQGWKPFYMYYGTDKYEFVHNGVPSYWMSPRGLDRAQDGPLTYFLHCTIGHHGLLSLSPVLLLTLGGWLAVRNWRQSPLRRVHGIGLGLTLIVFGFFMTRTQNYNYGGNSVALRWMLWLVPFWLLAMVPALNAWQPARFGRGVCLLLLSVSAFSAWYPLDGPWKQPWLFSVMSDKGWIDYSDPPPPKQRPFYSWIRQVPDAPGDEPIVDYWIEFEGLDAEGRFVTLRLADAGGVTVDDRRARRVDVTRTFEGGSTDRQQLVLDVSALATDAAPRDVLVWPDGEPTESQRRKALAELHGLPSLRAYAPGRLRYVGESRLRPEAFQTRTAASRVLGTPADHPRPTIHRRDLWLTGDVPYGVLQTRLTIQDYKSGEVIRQQTLRAFDAGQVETFNAESLIFE